jgi:large conductance mechanosensitive channel
MGLIKEFKEFAMRGNVIDLAVGVIIGGAFGKIVNSLVTDVILPPVGVLIGGVKFSDLKMELVPAEKIIDATTQAEKIVKEAVTLNYGNFIQMVFEFLIIAFSVFIMIKLMNKAAALRKKEVDAAPVVEPSPTKEEQLLTEIRDLLKNK